MDGLLMVTLSLKEGSIVEMDISDSLEEIYLRHILLLVFMQESQFQEQMGK